MLPFSLTKRLCARRKPDGVRAKAKYPRCRPRVEVLEARLAPAAVPSVALTVPSQALLGESLTAQLSFTNTGSQTGYGPFIDLFLPATDNLPCQNPGPGITFVSATYLGQAVSSQVLTLTAAGIAHPLAVNSSGQPVIITPPAGFQPGDELVVLQLPFGGFTTAQPAIPIAVNLQVSNQADPSVSLPIEVQGGFQFGNDALDNPTTDPTIFGPAATSMVQPQVYTIQKNYLGPENETATGPNYPQSFQIVINVGNGVTIDNLVVTDMLPNNIVIPGAGSITVTGGGLVTTDPVFGSPANNNDFAVTFATLAGTASTNEATITYMFFAPQFDANGAAVLPASTGTAASSANSVTSTASYTYVDPCTMTSTVKTVTGSASATITLRSVATQKTVTNLTHPGASIPGDTLQYTVNTQVSDYFAFNNVVVTDTLSDGQAFNPALAPTLLVNGNPFTLPTTAFGPSNFFATVNANGTTTLVFLVSAQLLASLPLSNGKLIGGLINPVLGGINGTYNDGPTTFQIQFATTILNTYRTTPVANGTVLPGDVISDHVVVGGDLLDVNSLQPNGNSQTDDSNANVIIAVGPVSKSVYAINGQLVPGGATPVINPGDTVTYRLQQVLPATDYQALSLTDYLPLPIFDATTVTTFQSTVSATPPPAGQARFGPADTSFAATGMSPALSNPSTNALAFTFGNFNSSANQPTKIDLLFTVTVNNQPFADRLLLTNEVSSQQTKSDGTVINQQNIAPVQLSQPLLTITKGVVATNAPTPPATFTPTPVGPVTFDAPGSSGPRFTGTITTSGLASTPVNSNLANVQAGDLVTFAIVVNNVGSGQNGAFNVTLNDVLPADFKIPTSAAGLNLSVTDGAGTSLAFVTLGGGLFDVNGGIELVDPSSTMGALGPGITTSGVDINNGHNILIVTYDLQVAYTVIPAETIVNTATLTRYTNTETGPNFIPNGLSDDAEVTIRRPSDKKTLVSTSVINPNNSLTQAAIGELATYQVVITVPQGTTPNAILTDRLDAGLAYVQLISATTSNGVSFTGSGTPTVTNTGHTLVWNFKTISNADTDSSTPDTITLVYTAVVLNVASNRAGNQLKNSAVFTWDDGQSLSPVSATRVTVIEPDLTLTKTVNGASSANLQATNPITYGLQIANPSSTDAYDVTLSDPFPLTNGTSVIQNPIIVSVVTNPNDPLITAANFQLTGTNATGWTLSVVTPFKVAPGESVTVTIGGALPSSAFVSTGAVLPNTARLEWQSLPSATPTTQISPFNTDSTIRTGTGTPSVNNYFENSTATIVIGNVPFKTIQATSEVSTPGSDVAVGEIVQYRLQGAFPASTGVATLVNDMLGAGLAYLTGTAKIAFVRPNGQTGFISSAFGPDMDPANAPYVDGDASTVDTIVPTFVIPGGLVVQAGNTISFTLGTVTNPYADKNEFILITLNALVLNVSGNAAGQVLNNSFSVSFGGTLVTTPAPVGVTVVEPKLVVSKTATPATGQGGDPVTYTVGISNPSGTFSATAFNVTLIDVLPAVFTNIQIVSVPPGATTNITGNTLTVSFAQLPVDGSALITYTATVTSAAVANTTYLNNATVTWTSIPGTQGTFPNPTGSQTPGMQGAPNGGRNGQDGPTGLNDYIAMASAPFTIATPDIQKFLGATSLDSTTGDNLNIGEVATFVVVASFPHGTTPSTVVVDNLPFNPGVLSLLGSHVVFIGKNLSGNVRLGDQGVASDTNNDGFNDQASFSLGTIVDSGVSNSLGADSIVFLVFARLVNVPANQPQLIPPEVLTNVATLSYATGPSLQDQAQVEVVGPVLQVTKTASPTRADAGDVVTYTVTVSHVAASTGPAFDLAVADPLNAGRLQLIPGSVTVSGNPRFPAVVTTGNGPTDTTVLVNAAELDLGQTLTISYQARLTAADLPTDVVPNTVALNYSSYPTPPGGGRPGSTQASSQVTINSNGLSGIVYQDVNSNGVFDNGDILLPNVTVDLSGTDNLGNHVTAATLTGGTGSYHFDLLRPGVYTVTETPPAGLINFVNNAGTPFASIITILGQQTIRIPAGSNTTGIDYDFGLVSPARLAGLAFADYNDDGIFDGPDFGIAGVIITLTGQTTLNVPVRVTATTANDGTYSFVNLPPGTYAVDQGTVPAYLIPSQSLPGVPSGGVSNGPNEIANVRLAQGVGATAYNFASLPQATAQGFVWDDLNDDGIKEPGEPGIAGVPIQLTGTDALGHAIVLNATTDANGFYDFQFLNAPTNTQPLLPGSYTITLLQPPADYLPGINQNAASVPAPVVTQTVFGSIPLTQPPFFGGDYNFAFIRPLSVGDTVWNDLNNNGRLDPGEPGIGGVLVDLQRADGTLVAQTTTNAAGGYIFNRLIAGTYRVTIDAVNFTAGGPLEGYSSSTGLAGSPTGPFEPAPNNNINNEDKGTIVGVLSAGGYVRGGLIDLQIGTQPLNETPIPGGLVDTSPDGNSNLTQDFGFFALHPVGQSEIAIVKSVTPTTVTVGERVTYSFTVRNNGPDTATNVIVTDPFPPGIGVVGAGSVSQGSFDPISQTWYVGTLVNGGVATLQVVAQINVAGVQINLAVVSGDQFDPVLSNNLDSAQVLAQLSPDQAGKGNLITPTVPALVPIQPVDLPGPAAGNVGLIAAGADAGNLPLVTVYDRATGGQKFSLLPFPAPFRGGVRVALGDVNGGGFPDIIAAAGPGGGPQVVVYDGGTGRMITSFYAMPAGFTGGLTVASADVNGDGVADIIVGAGPGGGPQVSVFDGKTFQLISSFYAFPQSFRGGVSVAAADVTGQGRARIVTGAGAGGGPQVSVFDALSGQMLQSFYAFDPSFRGGVSVAAGDFRGNGKLSIFTGAGSGGGPQASIFDAQSGALLASFYAEDASFRGGVRVAAADVTAEGKADLVTAYGPGVSPHIRTYASEGLSLIDDFFAFNPSFLGGVNVAASLRR